MQIAISLVPLEQRLAQDWALRALKQRVQTHEPQAVSPGPSLEPCSHITQAQRSDGVGRYQQHRSPPRHTDTRDTYLV